MLHSVLAECKRRGYSTMHFVNASRKVAHAISSFLPANDIVLLSNVSRLFTSSNLIRYTFLWRSFCSDRNMRCRKNCKGIISKFLNSVVTYGSNFVGKSPQCSMEHFLYDYAEINWFKICRTCKEISYVTSLHKTVFSGIFCIGRVPY